MGLARLGADVRLVVRDVEKGATVRARARGAGARCARSSVDRCDVSDLDDVRRFAADLDVDRLDVLVHNAGAMPPTRTESPQGHELTMALHVLGPLLMTELLRPVLTGHDARVVFVTSGGMYGQRLRADDPEYLDGEYSRTTAYARSKRAQVELLPLLARAGGRPPASGCTRRTPAGPTPLAWSTRCRGSTSSPGPLLRDAEGGADTTVWLAAAEPQPPSGQLWHDRRARPTHLLARYPHGLGGNGPDVVLGRRPDRDRAMSRLATRLRRTVPAVVAAAGVGGLGTRPRSAWYLALDKPRWQPPAAAFGPAWTTLYALIAAGTAQAMARAGEAERARLEPALWINLGLNAGWSWLFFTARAARPRAGGRPSAQRLQRRPGPPRGPPRPTRGRGPGAVRRMDRLRDRAQLVHLAAQPPGVARPGPHGEPCGVLLLDDTQLLEDRNAPRPAIARASLRTSYAQSKLVLRLYDLPAGRCGTSSVPSKQVLCPYDLPHYRTVR